MGGPRNSQFHYQTINRKLPVFLTCVGGYFPKPCISISRYLGISVLRYFGISVSRSCPYPKPLTPRMPLCFESGADPSLPICFGSAHLSKQSATSMPQQLERISAKCTLLREWCGSDPKFWLGSAPLSKQSAKNMLPDPQQIKANWSGSAHLSKQSAIPSNRSQSLNPKP